MESSNTPNPVADTAENTASVSETSANETNSSSQNLTPEVPKADLSLSEKIESLSKAPADKFASPAVDPALPSFQPNWKYKAFGKEKEIDAFWQPLVKDADSEKKVKDLFTRADAFDDLKSRNENTQNQFQGLLTEYQALDRDVRKVIQFKNSGDLENFFNSVKISDDQIFDYARRKLEMANLPPEQRQAFALQAQERQRLYDLQEQNQYLEQNYQTQAVHARTTQLDMVMMTPEIQSAANAWDQKTGMEGSFRDLVIEEGQRHAYTTGEDLPPAVVANRVLSRFGKFLAESQAPGTASPAGNPGSMHSPQAPLPPGTTQVVTKPVIPSASGRGTSPVAKSPKSIDDLKRMAKEMARAGQ